MSDLKPPLGYSAVLPDHVSNLKWRWKDDYVLHTPLGIDDCRVEVVDTDEYVALKPSEDERIRREQARLFCEWVINTQGTILGRQLHYLLGLFDLSQRVLADALQLTAHQISQLVTDRETVTPHLARLLALIFALECSNPGTIEGLAEGHLNKA